MVSISVGRLAALVLFVGMVAAQPARADDPAFVALGAGWFDFNRQHDPGVEFRAEYRGEKLFWHIKPLAAVGYTTTGQGFVGAGILMDVFFGNRWVLTPSFAPHYYFGSNSKLDLGHEVEFRSQLEAAYRFDDRSRLGVAISHYSNAGLGRHNPGTETLSVYYSIPLGKPSNP